MIPHNRNKIIVYRLGLVMMLMALATTALAVAQDATISTVSHDMDVMQNGERGMLIHVKFYVDNMAGEDGRVNVYFYKSDGTKLRDFDDRYLTTNGYVAAWKGFTVNYASAKFDDFKIFMPYKQLHLGKGRYDLKYDVAIWDNSRQLANSNYYYSFALDDAPKEDKTTN